LRNIQKKEIKNLMTKKVLPHINNKTVSKIENIQTRENKLGNHKKEKRYLHIMDDLMVCMKIKKIENNTRQDNICKFQKIESI